MPFAFAGCAVFAGWPMSHVLSFCALAFTSSYCRRGGGMCRCSCPLCTLHSGPLHSDSNVLGIKVFSGSWGRHGRFGYCHRFFFFFSPFDLLLSSSAACSSIDTIGLLTRPFSHAEYISREIFPLHQSERSPIPSSIDLLGTLSPVRETASLKLAPLRRHCMRQVHAGPVRRLAIGCRVEAHEIGSEE